jgi:hypothetical protein
VYKSGGGVCVFGANASRETVGGQRAPSIFFLFWSEGQDDRVCIWAGPSFQSLLHHSGPITAGIVAANKKEASSRSRPLGSVAPLSALSRSRPGWSRSKLSKELETPWRRRSRPSEPASSRSAAPSRAPPPPAPENSSSSDYYRLPLLLLVLRRRPRPRCWPPSPRRWCR